MHPKWIARIEKAVYLGASIFVFVRIIVLVFAGQGKPGVGLEVLPILKYILVLTLLFSSRPALKYRTTLLSTIGLLLSFVPPPPSWCFR